MIVEFIGCSGAGKTTLGRMLCRHEIGGRQVLGMSDLVLNKVGSRRITHPTAVNLVQDLYALPFVIRARHRRLEFFNYAVRMLARNSLSRAYAFNSLRSILRRTGMYELARSRASDKIVISDEGTVLTAYRLFIYANAECGSQQLEEFAQLVPLPDKIVYVKVPVSSLIERATRRPDRRRQLSRMSAVEVERRVNRAVDVFEGLVTTSALRDRVIVMENGYTTTAERERLVDDLRRQLGESVSDPTQLSAFTNP